ncbi:MAG: cytochrome c3 family protein [Mariprofundaceae bacterium]
MPKHVARLIAIMVATAAVAIIARGYFTAESFGEYGHYRANAVPEIAAQRVIFQGQQSCKQCHAERHAEWAAGSHHGVSCENCHGPARDHPVSGKLPIPADTVRLCASCHEAMPARPAMQPQIIIAEHAGAQACIECHNPHSPAQFAWEESNG